MRSALKCNSLCDAVANKVYRNFSDTLYSVHNINELYCYSKQATKWLDTFFFRELTF